VSVTIICQNSEGTCKYNKAFSFACVTSVPRNEMRRLVQIMKQRKFIKYGIITAAFVCLYIGFKVILNYNPHLAYEWITGNQIPEDVVAVNYGSLINDNLFHSGHYWEFLHSEAGLQNLLGQLGAGNKYENYENVTNYLEYEAIWTLGNVETALGKKIDKNTIGKGYEIPGANSRDNWLLVNKSGDRSYYVFN